MLSSSFIFSSLCGFCYSFFFSFFSFFQHFLLLFFTSFLQGCSFSISGCLPLLLSFFMSLLCFFFLFLCFLFHFYSFSFSCSFLFIGRSFCFSLNLCNCCCIPCYYFCLRSHLNCQLFLFNSFFFKNSLVFDSSCLYKAVPFFSDSDCFILNSPVFLSCPLLFRSLSIHHVITPTLLVLTWEWINTFERLSSTKNATSIVSLLDIVSIVTLCLIEVFWYSWISYLC